tara:strand:+ start:684 stop:938 length:255 start_codon:yes stop_codon:yes gene_type:complete
MSIKKDTENDINDEMFEDCPKALQEYESEKGVNSYIKKPYSEFFVQSLNNSEDYEVKIPKGSVANYGSYAELSHVKKVFTTTNK